jgi:hypothetical protein
MCEIDNENEWQRYRIAQAIIGAIEAWNLRERPEPDLFTIGGEQ